MHKRKVAIATALFASLLGTYAHAACCYFAAKDKDILQPGQKAFINWNPAQKSEAFTVQPKFEGNAMDFGMVIPTPARPKLDEMPRDFFKDLAMYTILMPLPEPIYSPFDPQPVMKSAMRGFAPGQQMSLAKFKGGTVHVLESGIVGSLDYKIILAENASDLFQWLKDNHYTYSGDEGTLNYYIKKKWIFTVMKIDSKQMKKTAGGSFSGEVTPTRFTFASADCIYPLKITQISVKDKTDALFYVQAPNQMDLKSDWSWMHSYRPMYLTYMLGCGANAQEQTELEVRNRWLQTKRSSDSSYETTKLEWAKKLGPSEIAVLEDPQKKYAQMGTGELPPGSKVISLKELIEKIKAEYTKQNSGQLPDYAKDELVRMEDQYQPAKGVIVENDTHVQPVGYRSYNFNHFMWYPARSAPMEDIKGLVRLKGQLRQGEWLTKFRKQIRKNDMTDDLVLSTVPKEHEQTYIRIMPTSPP
jgi:hypothetical protein